METTIHIQQALSEISQRLGLIEEKITDGLQVKMNWLDSADICQLLRISKRTLANYRESGLIPYSQLGRKIYYHLADVEYCLASTQVRKAYSP
ncbi:MAG: helix-turn-helix domain-containing protein [Bacteroidota bacterium]